MTKIKNILILIILASPAMLFAQEQTQDANSSFEQASQSVQRRLEQSVAELNKLREQVADEKVPLSRKLNELEAELVKVRLEYQQTTRLLDSRTLDLSNLRSEIKSRNEEAAYLSNLLGEYIRNFESRLHIAKIQRYRETLETAKLAPENSNFSQQEIYKAQAGLLDTALERLEDALGGTSFNGTASDSGGSIHKGTFILMGPAAIFRSDDGKNIGTAEQRLGSLEPAVIAFGNPGDANEAAKLITASAGLFPLDPTLGNAHKIESTKETLAEHIKKGGPVMAPILGLAGAALLVAIYKWISMAFLRKPSQKRLAALLDAVARRNGKAALQETKAIRGPVGKMLVIGVEHLSQPRELIEEVMYEEVQATRLKLNRLLPFVALSASSAPLLGLLGTVTGMLATFKALASGSGGEKTMGLVAQGISEALITTETGLVIALPGLLFVYMLARHHERYKAFLAHLETVCTQTVYKKLHRQKAVAAQLVSAAKQMLQSDEMPCQGNVLVK